MILGVVLAGGRSSRFGREKALAELEGQPFVARVASVLASGSERVAVNAPEDSGAAAYAAEHGLTLLHDPAGAPDGPLAGVVAGLAWAEAAGASSLCTAPCDTPRLPADMVARLAAAMNERSGATAARTADGLQPLCTLWRVEALPTVRRLTAGGVHPAVREVLVAVGYAEVRFEDAGAFRNVNTPKDLALLRE